MVAPLHVAAGSDEWPPGGGGDADGVVAGVAVVPPPSVVGPDSDSVVVAAAVAATDGDDGVDDVANDVPLVAGHCSHIACAGHRSVHLAAGCAAAAVTGSGRYAEIDVGAFHSPWGGALQLRCPCPPVQDPLPQEASLANQSLRDRCPIWEDFGCYYYYCCCYYCY